MLDLQLLFRLICCANDDGLLLMMHCSMSAVQNAALRGVYLLAALMTTDVLLPLRSCLLAVTYLMPPPCLYTGDAWCVVVFVRCVSRCRPCVHTHAVDCHS